MTTAREKSPAFSFVLRSFSTATFFLPSFLLVSLGFRLLAHLVTTNDRNRPIGTLQISSTSVSQAQDVFFDRMMMKFSTDRQMNVSKVSLFSNVCSDGYYFFSFFSYFHRSIQNTHTHISKKHTSRVRGMMMWICRMQVKWRLYWCFSPWSLIE